MKSLYETLGVPTNASAAVIKQAYKRQAMKLHPDRDGGSHEAMAALQEAYDVLSDSERRARYDATGNTDKPEDPLDKVKADIAQVLDSAIAKLDKGDGDDLNYNDPIQEVRDSAHQAIKAQERQIQSEKRLIEQRQVALARLKQIEGSDRFLHQVLEGSILRLQENLGRQQASIDRLHQALDILARYEYEADEKPEKPEKAEPYKVFRFSFDDFLKSGS